MHSLFTKLLALSIGLTAFSAHAAVATCTLDTFTITSMKSSVTGAPVALPGPIGATSCFGVVPGNDAQGGLNAPELNLGYLGDGLLNGGTFKGTQYVDPGQFIDASEFQALKDPQKPVDPGWIMLGTLTDKLGTMNAYDKPLDIGQLLSFDMNANGTWSFKTNPNIVQLLQDSGYFGKGYFDHLAFVVKAGSGKKADGPKAGSGKKADGPKAGTNADADVGGWAIYDFNFNDILAKAPGAFSLSQPYSFDGEWNMDDFDGKDISHMSVWARDPATSQSVPLPGTVFLAGIGLLALGLTRKRPSK